MKADHYSIGTLAKSARVTDRTIRFYTAEGLLPPPLSEGRYAVYTAAHLRRLQLIQRLKAAYLPLATIRQQLDALPDAEIDRLLGNPANDSIQGELPQSGVRIKSVEPHVGQNGVQYLEQILAVSGYSALPAAEPGTDKRPKRARLVSPTFRPAPADRELASATAQLHSSIPLESWHRIVVDQGIELHVRTPLSEEMHEKVRRLLEFYGVLSEEKAEP